MSYPYSTGFRFLHIAYSVVFVVWELSLSQVLLQGALSPKMRRLQTFSISLGDWNNNELSIPRDVVRMSEHPRETKYVALEDGRKLCLECLDSAIMDTNQCQPLYLDIQEFYEGLNIKVEQQVPLLLVERQALNEAMDGEKSGHHHMPETRGLCLSEEQTVSTVRMFARPVP
ncbi:hypothetical protein RHMOL_Rhmol04G0129100 [Rhododendron molle]|uniref:Uncharacterized protein n=1 Tax=Rhododendron molle TaxID=49168 RepID=A0ACC0P122_RHOML|nr:hypothetical protein RHMOL_Rhmol04G0129100 [Rhododendron molle]